MKGDAGRAGCNGNSTCCDKFAQIREAIGTAFLSTIAFSVIYVYALKSSLARIPYQNV